MRYLEKIYIQSIPYKINIFITRWILICTLSALITFLQMFFIIKKIIVLAYYLKNEISIHFENFVKGKECLFFDKEYNGFLFIYIKYEILNYLK